VTGADCPSRTGVWCPFDWLGWNIGGASDFGERENGGRAPPGVERYRTGSFRNGPGSASAWLRSGIGMVETDWDGGKALPSKWTAQTRGAAMPTYMDVHDIPGVKAGDVANAHDADLRVQDKYGVNYKSYWVNEAEGKVFCLVDAPDKESASRVHREAHGLEAHTLYEVEQGA
jgi:hypothetical protein